MSEFQRMIKNFAIVLAVFLSVMIIGSIATGVMMVLGMTSAFPKHASMKTENFSEEYDASDIKNIHIKNTNGKLRFEEGDTFKVVGTNVNSDFKCRVNGSHTLTIASKAKPMDWLRFINQMESTEIIVTVPMDYTADKVTIDAGAGTIELNNLVTEKLYLNCGAGNISGSGLTSGKVKIDGGVGNIDFSDVDFTDMYLDCGVGNVTMNGVLYGKTDINCGVGECDITIQNKVEEYNLDFDPGVGSIYVNGQKRGKGNAINPSLENSITIDGGVGNVNLRFE